MRTHAHPLAALAIAASAVIGLAACSSDNGAAPTTSKVQEAAPITVDTAAARTDITTADTTSATTEGTSASTGGSTASSVLPTPDELIAQLEPLLLTPEEVGPSFVKQPFSDPPGGTPCGIEVESTYPAYAITGTELVEPEPLLAMLEEVRVYPSRDDAAAAYKLAVTGFSCGSAEGLTLGTPTDLSSQLGVTGVGISLATDQYEGAIVIAQDRDAIFVFQFQAAIGADTSSVPDPATVATAGIKKINDALTG
ncbi:MAG: hypothetical protein JWN62_4769 [Acidimicrobiales bacterium]|nr:hypothetical protein [Acidimicrobiales bacterium]